MNVFLNENWQDIFNELKPAVQDSFAAVFKELANRMFKKVSFNDIYLSWSLIISLSLLSFISLSPKSTFDKNLPNMQRKLTLLSRLKYERLLYYM